ncbi:MAG: hypothetical protein ACTSPO_15780 [Candidatus Heimdallarchaeaceae archaeon]
MMENEIKNNLLTVLTNIKRGYLANCLAVYTLFEINPSALPNTLTIENEHFPEDTQILDVRMIKPILVNPSGRQLLRNENSKTILRAFVRGIFEVVKTYAKNTNQYRDICKGSSLFNFTRLIRNSLAHSFRFNFEHEKTEGFPVKWRDKEITLEMDGKIIDFSIINFATVITLFDDLYQFVKDKLN